MSNKCPQCGSYKITADTLEVPDGDSTSRKVKCDDCRTTWTEVWEFIHIEAINVPEEEA
jgi:predicted Zn finger-like uncharacterized protein